MKRLNLILGIVLAAQIVLSLVVFWPRAAATGGGGALFPDLKADDVVALTVTDDQGASTSLRKAGEAWVVPDADDYPADAARIAPLVDKLARLDTRRLVTRTEASHGRLKVAAGDYVRRIDFETAGARYTVYLGSAPSYSTTHFRLEGQNETYLTDALSAWDVSAAPASWVNATYFTLDKETLTRVTLKNAHGTFVFTKDEQGNWTWTGLKASEQLAASAVTALINNVTSVTLVRPLGKQEDAAYGMAAPLATVTLEAGDKTVTLLVGAQDPADKSYVVKVSESPYYVRVGEYNVKALVEDTRDSFVQPPPTPTPEVAPTP
jgi:hypothetical protein